MKNFKNRKELTIEEAQKAYDNGYGILVVSNDNEYISVCNNVAPIVWVDGLYKFYYATQEEVNKYDVHKQFKIYNNKLKCIRKRIPKVLHKSIIEEFILNGISSRQLAKDYDISVASVYRIIHKYGYNKTWGKI